MRKNKNYRATSRQIWGVLATKTVSGTAHTYVTKYRQTQDGILAYKEIENHCYKIGGDSATFARLLNQLQLVKFTDTSSFGYAGYEHQFDTLRLQISVVEGSRCSMQSSL